MGEKQTEEVV